jgi:GDPmannose 4,6-dehydratase
MLQQDQPDDYVVATGVSLSIRDFLNLVFGQLGMDWQEFVVVDPQYFRPAEVNHLEGDASKAQRILGWNAQTDVAGLASMMVASDLAMAERELRVLNALT